MGAEPAGSNSSLEEVVRAQAAAIDELREQVARLEAALGVGRAGGAAGRTDAGLTPTPDAPVADGEADPHMSRRRLLTRAAGGLAVGAAVIASRPAAAAAGATDPGSGSGGGTTGPEADGDALFVGRTNVATAPTVVDARTTGDGFWVRKTGAGSTVLAGTTFDSAAGVYGRAGGFSPQPFVHAGVVGVSGTLPGVVGLSGPAHGVRGESESSDGVAGIATRAGAGVTGTSTSGVGGRFAGGSAAIRLVPRTEVGPPTTGAHEVGEIVVDRKGFIFACKAAGTPGTWRKLTFG